MSAGSDPAHRPLPRAGRESQDATLAWLDALANGICPPEVFLGAMRDEIQGHRDEGWEILSLLDQYYRRGKIKSDVFHSLKASLEDVALTGDQSSTRTEEIQAAPPPPAARQPAVAPPPPPAAAQPRAAPEPSVAAQPSVAARPSVASQPRPPPQPPAAAQSAAAAQAAAQALANARARSATAVTAPAPVLNNPVPKESRTAPPREARASRPAVAEPKVSPIGRPAVVREVAIGDVLRGRYRVRGVVGYGGMGTVFEASDDYRVDLPTAGRRLAIKVLHTAVTQREELLAELQREFQHLQLLSHPNIVRVHEFDRDGDVAFFTMELLSGALLSLVLQARKGIALPRRYALAVIRDAGAALSHAHSRGVIHGDINPQNIFITHDGELRVLDFGASHNLLPERWTTDDAVTLRSPVATPGYASCQQLEGQQPDVRDDLFAFACVIYVLLSGQHPFPKRTAIEARTQRLRPRRPPGLSGQQWRVLREGLRWDRERRPSNVQEWLDRFGLGAAAPRLPVMPVLVNTAAPGTRKPMLAAAALAMFALLGAGGYWIFTHHDSLERDYDSLARNFEEWRNQSSAPSAPEVPAASAPESLPAPTPPAPAPAAPQSVAKPASVAKTSPAAKPTAAAPKPALVAAPAAAPTPAASHAAAAPADRLAAVRAGTAGPVRIEMASDTVDVSSGETAAHISVRRRGNIHGAASFKWWTESGTAKPGVDFSPVMPRVASIADGSGSVGLDIPVSASRRAPAKSFYVVIDQSDDSGATLGARALTMVTLLPPE